MEQQPQEPTVNIPLPQSIFQAIIVALQEQPYKISAPTIGYLMQAVDAANKQAQGGNGQAKEAGLPPAAKKA